MILELGGGTNPHPQADIVIDLHHPKAAPAQDATDTPWRLASALPEVAVYQDDGDRWWHLDDGSVDAVVCSHFLEHVAKGTPIIDLMNEAHRVLRPGGTLTAILPLIGFTDPIRGRGQLVQGWQPYADPTHVQGWWFPESILYFCAGPFKPHADYGIREWAALGEARLATDRSYFSPGVAWPVDGTDSFWAVREGWEGVVRMVKP